MASAGSAGSITLASAEEMFRSEEEEMQGQNEAWRITFAFAESMAAKCVVLLGIPDIIAAAGSDAALTVSEIAEQLQPTESPNVNVDLLSRIMSLLGALRFFTATTGEDGICRYGLSPTSKWMLSRKRKPQPQPQHRHSKSGHQGEGKNDDNDVVSVSMVPQLLLDTDQELVASWQMLHRSVLGDGTAFSAAHGGVEMLEYLAAEPRLNWLFNSAMAANTRIFFSALLKSSYRGFDHVSSLVDCGGGVGAAAAQIAKAFPNIRRVVNLDLPHVLSTAPALPGVEHVTGDMFHSVPSADAVFLKYILHGRSDEDCLTILRNCKRAIPSNGKLIIVDIILNDEKETSHGKLDPVVGLVFNVVMATVDKKQGRERSEAEWAKLLRTADFSRYTVFRLPALQSILEAFP